MTSRQRVCSSGTHTSNPNPNPQPKFNPTLASACRQTVCGRWPKSNLRLSSSSGTHTNLNRSANAHPKVKPDPGPHCALYYSSSEGMRPVANPSSAFLSKWDELEGPGSEEDAVDGSAVLAAIEGMYGVGRVGKGRWDEAWGLEGARWRDPSVKGCCAGDP